MTKKHMAVVAVACMLLGSAGAGATHVALGPCLVAKHVTTCGDCQAVAKHYGSTAAVSSK